jgi:hypothetical protein
MDLNRLVWVTVGKTDHQAWLVDEEEGSSSNEDEVLIQWDSARFNEWVPRSSVRHEMTSSRRRSVSRVARTTTSQTTSTETKSKRSGRVTTRKSHPQSKIGETNDRRNLRSKKRSRPSQSTTTDGGCNHDDEPSLKMRQLDGREPDEIDEVTAIDYIKNKIKLEVESRDQDEEEGPSFTETQQRVFHELLTGESLFTPKSKNRKIRRNSGEGQEGDIGRPIVDRTPDSSVGRNVYEEPDTISSSESKQGIDVGRASRRISCADNYIPDCVSESGLSSVPTLDSLSSSNAVSEVLNSLSRADVKVGFGGRRALGRSVEDFFQSRRDVQELVSTLQLDHSSNKNLLLLASVLDFLPNDS